MVRMSRTSGTLLQDDGLVGEQRRADVGQRGVLGPRDADRALEGPAPHDADPLHAMSLVRTPRG